MASTIPSEDDRLSLKTVKKAVRALQKWRTLHPKVAQKPSSQSFEEEEDEEENSDFLDQENDDGEYFIYLLLTLKKIPHRDLSRTPHTIPLPNPLHSFVNNHQGNNLCLITDDRPTKSPARITAEFSLKKIKSEDIPITKVLKLSKLKSECKSFEGRRNLYNSVDMFLADKRVLPLLPKILGKQFYKKKRKVPVPLDLRGSIGWKEQIESACISSVLCFGTGTCSVLKVGRCGLKNGMETDEIVENAIAAIRGIAEIVPKKWGGIRALHLKLSDSLALPVYDALAKFKEAKENLEVEDEKKMMEAKLGTMKTKGNDKLRDKKK